MLKLIPPILIFLSLGVIIVIVGKHASQIKKTPKDGFGSDEKEPKGKSKLKEWIFSFGSLIKSSSIWTAEWIVKKTKRFLHVVHFWLIKMRRRGDSNMTTDIEVSKELFIEEKRNLENVVIQDLAEEEISVRKISAEDILPEENRQQAPKEKIFPETEDKIGDFFSNNDIETTNNSKKFLSRFFKRNNREPLNRNLFGVEQNQEVFPQGEAVYGEGIIEIRKKTPDIAEENRLIKEVVTVKRRDEADLDEELGVDRKILEKKIIQKITKDPKNVENYRHLGELYIKMKNYPDAEESYKQILRIAPRDIDAKRKLEKIKLLKRLS